MPKCLQTYFRPTWSKKRCKKRKDVQKLSQKMAANVRNLDTTAKGIRI